ncbi:MAG: NTP transferase domain-containing protein [Deltaproteobacteria bacterium]|nr:NTP transferase domain-containing protein [Deltaproteobacteria bacterium]
MVQCVVLAGGLATRLRPLTEKVPKSLLEVGGEPFVHHQLRWMARTGVTDAVLCVGFLGGMIRDAVGNGSRFGLAVHWVDEGTPLRGTAGALRCALDAGVLAPSFLVTYGDSWLPVDFSAVHAAFTAQPLPALMTVFPNEGRWDASNVVFEDGRLVAYDKRRPEALRGRMRHVDYGLGALRRTVVEERVPATGAHDLADVLRVLAEEGRVAGLEMRTRFYEIGSPTGLAELDALFRAGGMPPAHPLG